MNPFVVILIVLLVLLCLLGGLCAISPLHCPGGTHKCCPDSNPNGLGCHCLPNHRLTSRPVRVWRRAEPIAMTPELIALWYKVCSIWCSCWTTFVVATVLFVVSDSRRREQ